MTTIVTTSMLDKQIQTKFKRRKECVHMANFKKESGNSTKGVELIAVVRPGRVATKTDEATGETKTTAVYAEVMTNNSNLKKADIQAGKGQENPNLYSKPTEYVKDGETKKGYDNGIRFSPKQLETIEAAGGKNTLTTEDGTKYIPFKADVMGLTESVKDKEGKPVMGDDGKPKQQLVGYMPNTKTVEPTELGKLTENKLNKHFENTTAINDVKDAQRAEAKAAKLQAASEKAPAEVSADKGKEASIAD